MTQPIRDFVSNLLTERGKPAEFSDSDALFTSGLLDSLAATELMLHLESDHGVDLADADFDISMLDTINDLSGLVSQPA
jgi:acyl carrier protein